MTQDRPPNTDTSRLTEGEFVMKHGDRFGKGKINPAWSETLHARRGKGWSCFWQGNDDEMEFQKLVRRLPVSPL